MRLHIHEGDDGHGGLEETPAALLEIMLQQEVIFERVPPEDIRRCGEVTCPSRKEVHRLWAEVCPEIRREEDMLHGMYGTLQGPQM